MGDSIRISLRFQNADTLLARFHSYKCVHPYLVCVEPGGGDAGVLALAREEVDEVDEDAGRHQDLEVVVLPGVDEPGRQ